MNKQNDRNPLYRERLRRILNTEDVDRLDSNDIIDFAYDNLEAGQIDNARDLFLINLKTEGNSPDSLNGLAITLCEKGEVAQAMVVIKKAVELYPDDPVTVANMGSIASEAGDFAQAVYHYNRSLEIDPRSVDTHASLIELYMDTGDFGMALITCRTALDLVPGDESLQRLMEDIILEMAISG